MLLAGNRHVTEYFFYIIFSKTVDPSNNFFFLDSLWHDLFTLFSFKIKTPVLYIFIYLIKDCIYIELLKYYLPGLNCHLPALFYGQQFINVCHILVYILLLPKNNHFSVLLSWLFPVGLSFFIKLVKPFSGTCT